jgi:hypothetical protein
MTDANRNRIGQEDVLAHFFFGLLSSLSVIVSPVLTVISFLIFLSYELDEQWRIRDTGYIEILQFGFGFACGMVILLFLKFLFLV